MCIFAGWDLSVQRSIDVFKRRMADSCVGQRPGFVRGGRDRLESQSKKGWRSDVKECYGDDE